MRCVIEEREMGGWSDLFSCILDEGGSEIGSEPSDRIRSCSSIGMFPHCVQEMRVAVEGSEWTGEVDRSLIVQ